MAKAKKKPAAKKPESADSDAARPRITTMTPEDLEVIATRLHDYADNISGQAAKMRRHDMPTADILGIGLIERAYANVDAFYGNVVSKIRQT